ncbi:MAG: LysR family transcriptional regulator [Rhodobacteraceae bacterium]|nr:LysR family transcriptional regulator [Paracoccaceae bacterium]
MQQPNWNDLRILLAIAQHNSLAGAASALKIDATTVSRRLSALQSAFGAQLIERLGDGSYQLTPVGQSAAAQAEVMERELSDLQSRATGQDVSLTGQVRLSAVPMLINRLLIPAAPDFLDLHPGLELHLNADNRNLSLSRREADMAIRLARPRGTEMQIKTRRLGVLMHAIYGPKNAQNVPSSLPWITYSEELVFLPQAQWMKQEAGRTGDPVSPLRVSDAEAAIEAVANRIGRTVLPKIVGDADARLTQQKDAQHQPEFVREIWLMVRADLAKLARYRAVGDWLSGLFERT